MTDTFISILSIAGPSVMLFATFIIFASGSHAERERRLASGTRRKS